MFVVAYVCYVQLCICRQYSRKSPAVAPSLWTVGYTPSMRIVFFDTETTGGGEQDRLLSLAVKEKGREKAIVNAIYKPPVPITFESMAVHHITEKMARDEPLFTAAPEYKELKALFEHEDTVAVAHNVAFDLAMLSREGITPTRTICTYKIARTLDPEEKLANYRLQYLRYLLGLEVEATAHDALGDVLVLEGLFERLFVKMTEEKAKTSVGRSPDASEETSRGAAEEEALRHMIEISSRPMLFTTLRFGKHKGKRIEDVAKADASYLRWLLQEKKKDPAAEADWIYTLQHYLASAVR